MAAFNQYFIIILLICWGCVNTERKKIETNNQETNDSLVIQTPYHIYLPEKGKGLLTASFFADSIRYVPLETSNRSLLRRVTHVKMNDSIIGVSDMRNLFLFRKDGSFIRQIGRTGRGPGEYTNVYNFYFIKDTIYITSLGKISKYTFDGEFQEEKKVKSMVYSTVTPSHTVAWYDEGSGKVLFFDPDLNITDTVIVERNVSSGRGIWTRYDPEDNFFQLGKGKLLFTNYKSDTIWNLAGAKKKAEYILNLKDKLLPWDLQVENFKGDFKRYEKAVARYQKVNLIEISNYLFILQKTWDTGEVNTIYIHNFKDQSTEVFGPDYIYDNLIGRIKLQTRLSFSTEDAFITAIKATELLESLEELNKAAPIDDVRHNAWKTRMSKIKYDDNPILVIIKPRN